MGLSLLGIKGEKVSSENWVPATSCGMYIVGDTLPVPCYVHATVHYLTYNCSACLGKSDLP